MGELAHAHNVNVAQVGCLDDEPVGLYRQRLKGKTGAFAPSAGCETNLGPTRNDSQNDLEMGRQKQRTLVSELRVDPCRTESRVEVYAHPRREWAGGQRLAGKVLKAHRLYPFPMEQSDFTFDEMNSRRPLRSDVAGKASGVRPGRDDGSLSQ